MKLLWLCLCAAIALIAGEIVFGEVRRARAKELKRHTRRRR